MTSFNPNGEIKQAGQG